ncbi:MAG: ORF6N domain-containing protein [Elusimicrobiota bacterium]|nr:MAG: ORF6N domain-containing protein [Elusimicrobiota bacterium]
MGDDLARYIHVLRGHRVMLGGDLARLYCVELRALIQAVKRNRSRFPTDFCFQLDRSEYEILKSQIVISSWGGSRSAPYAFTEQGVAMLSSVLRSRRAIAANIAIMRAFVAVRALASQNRGILKKLAALESRVDRHDADIGSLIDAIRERLEPDDPPRRRIGFNSSE